MIDMSRMGAYGSTLWSHKTPMEILKDIKLSKNKSASAEQYAFLSDKGKRISVVGGPTLLEWLESELGHPIEEDLQEDENEP